MTTSIAAFARILLTLVTTGFLEASRCVNDIRLTPPGDVLIGEDTPVYFLNANASSPAGHTLRKRNNAMVEIKKIMPHYPETANLSTNIEDECDVSETERKSKLNFCPEFVAPNIIYPKMVLVVDYELIKYYGNLGKLLGFLVAFWGGVDLQFRTLEHPKLRLHIAGIVVSENNALSFLWKKDSPTEVNSDYAAESLARFMETNGTSWSQFFGDYDMVIVMTPFTFCRVKDYMCWHEAWELTNYRSRDMCEDVQSKGPPARGLLSMDGHDWMRIRAAAKLIEDMLSPWGLEGETFDCPKWDNAVAYSYGESTTDKPDWSKCYLDSFKRRFNKKKVSCMFPKPNMTSPLPRLLLGRIYDKENQCYKKRAIHGDSCGDEEICSNLSCKTMLFGFCSSIDIPAADGTRCGHKKICFRRKCVSEWDLK